ncbi:MAG: hypothetical protein D8M58_00970 [Calditrichaeota bacterium]|nr:MAG: hypothetical protein DWQ03_06110 [Calditrichota bacterium]MBL1203939.1 hypothetical protein [Calditrichota bacterium]
MKSKYISVILILVSILVFSNCTDRNNNPVEPKDEIDHGIIDFYSIEEFPRMYRPKNRWKINLVFRMVLVSRMRDSITTIPSLASG